MPGQLSVALTGFNYEEVKNYSLLLSSKGFAYDSCLKQTTSVLVANHTCTTKWIAAIKAAIPVVGELWLKECEENCLPDVGRYGLRRLTGLKISSTQLSLDERGMVEELCAQHGAVYSPALDESVSVLVTNKSFPTLSGLDQKAMQYAKLLHAQRCCIPVVCLDWLLAVVDTTRPPPDWKEFSAVPKHEQDQASIDFHHRRRPERRSSSARGMKAVASRPQQHQQPSKQQLEVGGALSTGPHPRGPFAETYFEANHCCLPADVKALIHAGGGTTFARTYAVPPDPDCVECGGRVEKKYVAASWIRRSSQERQPSPPGHVFAARPSGSAPQQSSHPRPVVRVYCCCGDGDDAAGQNCATKDEQTSADVIRRLGGTAANGEIEECLRVGLCEGHRAPLALTHVVLPCAPGPSIHTDRRGVSLSAPPPAVIAYLTHVLPTLNPAPLPRIVSADWLDQSARLGVFVDTTAYEVVDTSAFLRDYAAFGSASTGAGRPGGQHGDRWQSLLDIAPGRSFVIPSTPMPGRGGPLSFSALPAVPGSALPGSTRRASDGVPTVNDRDAGQPSFLGQNSCAMSAVQPTPRDEGVAAAVPSAAAAAPAAAPTAAPAVLQPPVLQDPVPERQDDAVQQQTHQTTTEATTRTEDMSCLGAEPEDREEKEGSVSRSASFFSCKARGSSTSAVSGQSVYSRMHSSFAHHSTAPCGEGINPQTDAAAPDDDTDELGEEKAPPAPPAEDPEAVAGARPEGEGAEPEPRPEPRPEPPKRELDTEPNGGVGAAVEDTAHSGQEDSGLAAAMLRLEGVLEEQKTEPVAPAFEAKDAKKGERRSRRSLGLSDSPRLKPFEHLKPPPLVQEKPAGAPGRVPQSVPESQMVRHALLDATLDPSDGSCVDDDVPAGEPTRVAGPKVVCLSSSSLPKLLVKEGVQVTENLEEAAVVVCPKPAKSVHFLGGIAGGKWVVHPSWITACNEAGRLVPEAPYEWQEKYCENLDRKRSSSGVDLVLAVPKWRDLRGGAYREWSPVAVVGEGRTTASYTTLLLCGGARVLAGAPYEEEPRVMIYGNSVSSEEIWKMMSKHPRALHLRADVLWMRLKEPNLPLTGNAVSAIDFARQQEQKTARKRSRSEPDADLRPAKK